MSKKQEFAHKTWEIIKDRLYFANLKYNTLPKSGSTPNVEYFCVDEELCYERFYRDFGPLNLAMLYRFCCKLNRKLKNKKGTKQKIVFYCGFDYQSRSNAAYLITAYAVIYLKKSPEEAFKLISDSESEPFVSFRDASYNEMSSFRISIQDCLNAIHKAIQFKFFDFSSFDVVDYEHYERVENGDLNWIVPDKFIAFCGPHKESTINNGYPLHSAESYIPYFRKHNVSTIVRLNKKMYNASSFTENDFDHKDLFFEDGSCPSDAIMRQFIKLSEQAKGVIAVHCKAGLGRTGTLIACYIMKHYKMTAKESIAWIRIMRPGSIIGLQQFWLENKQSYLWLQGDIHNNQQNNKQTTSTIDDELNNNKSNTLMNIVSKVDNIKLEDNNVDKNNAKNKQKNGEVGVDNKGMSQGDRLNRIKSTRKNHIRAATASNGQQCNHRSHHRTLTPQPKKNFETNANNNVSSPLKANMLSHLCELRMAEIDKRCLRKPRTRLATATAAANNANNSTVNTRTRSASSNGSKSTQVR